MDIVEQVDKSKNVLSYAEPNGIMLSQLESPSISYKGLYNRVIKRIIDFLFALIAVILLVPLYLLISLMIILDTGFPVFYVAQRGGYKGKAFRIFKFRSMVKDADTIGGGTTKLNDSRITRLGRILRKTKLDEIPQLFNILNGTMSFIGPRPELLMYTENYGELEKSILNVRPGITDFSSLVFINLDELVGDENADEMYEKNILHTKNLLRLKYVESISFRTDVTIFIKTIVEVTKKILKLFRRKSSAV